LCQTTSHIRAEEATAVKLAVIATLSDVRGWRPDRVAPLDCALGGSAFFAREACIADEGKEQLVVVFPCACFPAEPLS
jgi:hypothetical protein